MGKAVEGELMPEQESKPDNKTEYEKYWAAENQQKRLTDTSWWHYD